MIASDNSVTDPRHLAEIERAIVGDEPELLVWFVDHAARDHKAENAQKQRIQDGSDEVARPFFKLVPYIKKKFQGQVDYISKPATDNDKRQFPRQWEAYKAVKDNKHSIKLLPGNDVCKQAVFDELGLATIEDFLDHIEAHSEILEVFSELQPLHEVAKRWRTFMKPRLKLIDGELK